MELSNDKNLLAEPTDHAVGKSRGGLTAKIHVAVDGNRRPLVLLLGAGQEHQGSVMFENLLPALKTKKPGPGAARTRPDRAMADKSYSSGSIRKYLRDRGIQYVTPEREDRKANRKRKGKAGGRPVADDRVAYKRRNVVERSFNTLK